MKSIIYALSFILAYTLLSYTLVPILIIICKKIGYSCDTFTDYRYGYEENEAYNNKEIFENLWLSSPITFILFFLEIILMGIAFVLEELSKKVFTLVERFTK